MTAVHNRVFGVNASVGPGTAGAAGTADTPGTNPRRESTGRFTLATLEPGSPAATLAEEVRTGLTAAPKYLPCRFFYDEEGSQLFEQICELPEYYVTRAEREILAVHADEIVASLPAGSDGPLPVDLVELGSGSAAKTRLLIEALLRRQPALRYVPVDISRSALEASARDLLAAYRGLRVAAVAAEYQDGLRYLANLDALAAGTARGTAGDTRTTETAAVAGSASAAGSRLLLWLGSNVGNLDRNEAAAFLRGVCAGMGQDDRLLIGIDLRKDRAVLEAAYDDAQGVTTRFNKNLLTRVNRDLGGHFDLDSFAHRARYHETAGRVTMELVSTRAQAVRIDALRMVVPFAAGEAIHTENSFKYSDEEIESLAARSGFAVQRQWYDPERRFSDALLRPQPRA